MRMNIFKLEEYLAIYEFTTPYMLCCSDAESFSMQEIIDMADPEDRNRWDHLRLGYTEAEGMLALREQIAATLYPSMTCENILCFAGAEEGIFCALYTLCDASDHVIALAPCYQSLMEIPKLRGCELTTLYLHEDNQWRIDLEAIKEAIQPNTKCLVINFPHNPTGQIITQDELDALVALCDTHGIWLFSDEVYRLLGAPSTPWAKPAAELYPKALSLGVMSKAFGMPGLRIGWIACQDKALLKTLERMKHYTSICNSAPAEIISLVALKHSDKILTRNNAIVSDNLKLLDGFLKRYSNRFSWVQPQGGCVGFVQHKQDESSDVFCRRLAQEAGVLLMPASIYDHEGPYFRVGFGRKNMPEALERLVAFL